MIMFRSASALLLSGFSLSRAEPLTSTEQLEHALTMKEFDALSFTDVLREYGNPLTSEQGEDLFQGATKFAFDYASGQFQGSGESYETAGKEHYYSYVVCNSNGDNVSVKDRRDELIAEMKKAGINEDDVIVGTSFGSSTIDRSCWVVRVPGNAFADLFGANPDMADFVEVHPLLSEMKIAQQTVDAATLVLAGNKVSDITDKATEQDFLGLGLTICDGVYQFDGEETTDEDVTKDIVDFVKNGQAVKKMSFQYYHLGGGSELYSDRMKLWFDSIVAIADNGGTGSSNNCYNAIDTHMVKAADRDLDGFAITFDTVNSTKLGFDSDDERDACVFYIVHSLALHKDVCKLEPTLINTVDPPPGEEKSSGMSMKLSGRVSALLLAVVSFAISMF